MPIPTWKVPPMWRDETVVIAGGGRSLTEEQLSQCRGWARVIVINDNYLLSPWADLHYFCDQKWYDWHRQYQHPAQQRFGKARATSLFWGFQGLRVALESAQACRQHEPSIKFLRNYSKPEFHNGKHVVKEGLEIERKDGVRTGGNSGHQAINLAYHLGVSKIILLGFDQKGDHWFGDHPNKANADFAQSLAPRFKSLVKPLRAAGVEVVNCSPGSALTAFPRGTLADCLQ